MDSSCQIESNADEDCNLDTESTVHHNHKESCTKLAEIPDSSTLPENLSLDEHESNDEDGGWETEEDSADIDASHFKQAAMLRSFLRKSNELDLPKTVTLLSGPAGEVVYVVGTAHFSKQSCEDAERVISMVQPDAVVVELCASRVQVLSMDEDYLQAISNENKMTRLKKCINQKGLLSGLVLYMMLQMSSHITNQLKMAPGSEFRAALKASKTVPGCRLYLGDRPIEITLQRMLASLSFWQKLKFGFMMLQDLKPISAEEVEKMKERDIFEQLLSEMVEEFPHMARVLVFERDVYLAGFLQKVMRIPVQLPDDSTRPAVVVAVVGIGHANGIKSHFDTDVSPEMMDEIQSLPPPSRSKKILKYAIKGAAMAVAVYTAYTIAWWSGLHRKLTLWAPDV